MITLKNKAMKNLTPLAKGLIMTIVAILSQTIAGSGLPTTATGWAVFGITIGGSLLVYLGQNLMFPSVSVLGTINIADIGKGLFIAIGSGLSNWAATWIAGTVVNWHQLLTYSVSIILGYFAKNFATKNPPQI